MVEFKMNEPKEDDSRKDKKGVRDLFEEQDNWMFVPFLISIALLPALLAIQIQNMNGKTLTST